jgi:hypothetical protein
MSKRCWLLEPLKDVIKTGDKFVCRTSDKLEMSPMASAMIGTVVPAGWIVIRAMKNERRRAKRKDFFRQWGLWRKGKKSKFKPFEIEAANA